MEKSTSVLRRDESTRTSALVATLSTRRSSCRSRLNSWRLGGSDYPPKQDTVIPAGDCLGIGRAQVAAALRFGYNQRTVKQTRVGSKYRYAIPRVNQCFARTWTWQLNTALPPPPCDTVGQPAFDAR